MDTEQLGLPDAVTTPSPAVSEAPFAVTKDQVATKADILHLRLMLEQLQGQVTRIAEKVGVSEDDTKEEERQDGDKNPAQEEEMPPISQEEKATAGVVAEVMTRLATDIEKEVEGEQQEEQEEPLGEGDKEDVEMEEVDQANESDPEETPEKLPSEKSPIEEDRSSGEGHMTLAEKLRQVRAGKAPADVTSEVPPPKAAGADVAIGTKRVGVEIQSTPKKRTKVPAGRYNIKARKEAEKAKREEAKKAHAAAKKQEFKVVKREPTTPVTATKKLQSQKKIAVPRPAEAAKQATPQTSRSATNLSPS